MSAKRAYLAALLGASLFLSARAGASDVAVSVYAQTGSYGIIDIRDLPPPRLVYEEPVVIYSRPATARNPVYMHVPPGHAKHWSKHCRKYNACDRPVYFVDDRWYNEVYAPAREAKKKGDKHDKYEKQHK